MGQERMLAHQYSSPPGETSATDDGVVAMWLHGRPPTTQRVYKCDIARFRAFVAKPLQAVTLADFQAFTDSLDYSKPTSKARPIRAVKSLLTFAYTIGYTAFNVGKMVKPPKIRNTLAERIISEEQVMKMIYSEPNYRNQAMLRLLYASGIRVSELCHLCWKDVQPRGEVGQITVHGKGEKTRAILLKKETYQALESLRKDAAGSIPVFRSRGGGRGRRKAGGRLDPSQIMRIVQAAARRIGILENVSPHWLRHAHATHAQENGAPIALVQATLGHESIETTAKYSHARPDESSAQYLKM